MLKAKGPGDEKNKATAEENAAGHRLAPPCCAGEPYGKL